MYEVKIGYFWKKILTPKFGNPTAKIEGVMANKPMTFCLKMSKLSPLSIFYLFNFRDIGSKMYMMFSWLKYKRGS